MERKEGVRAGVRSREFLKDRVAFPKTGVENKSTLCRQRSRWNSCHNLLQIKKMKGEVGESVKVIFESPVHTVLDMSVIEEGCKQALTLSGYVSFF